MLVLITGGTGFIGSHIVRQLVADGHRVRLLIRDPEKFDAVLSSITPTAVDDVIVGDATDAASVAKAIVGCDSVVHAAAMVSLERRHARKMYRTNTDAATTVLSAAAARRLDPIVNVSSASVFELKGPSITTDSPIRMADSWYSRSKVEVERFVRGMQAGGTPVVSLYPSGVFGPDAPELTAVHQAAIGWMSSFPVMPSGFNMVDVSDVAQATSRVLKRGQGARSFLVGGHFLTWKELGDTLEEMTGRQLRRLAMPGPLIRGLGRIADVTRVKLPTEYPLTAEAMNEATRGIPIDSSHTVKALGLSFTDRWTTLRRGYEWLVEAGHLDSETVGNLGPAR
jgi:nucleoside-diphosphate-sugar epimerase